MTTNSRTYWKFFLKGKKYDSAKTLGQSVNESKQRINDLKTLIEQRRVQRSVAGGPDGEMEDDHEELQYKAQIEQRPVAGGPDGEMEVDHEELQYKAQIEQVGGGVGGGPDGEMVDDHEEQQYKAQIEQRSVGGGPHGEMEDDHEELQYKAQIEQRGWGGRTWGAGSVCKRLPVAGVGQMGEMEETEAQQLKVDKALI
eukprot:gene3530-13597_t